MVSHRGFGHTHDPGDLGGLHPFDLTQDERGALLDGQPAREVEKRLLEPGDIQGTLDFPAGIRGTTANDGKPVGRTNP